MSLDHPCPGAGCNLHDTADAREAELMERIRRLEQQNARLREALGEVWRALWDRRAEILRGERPREEVEAIARLMDRMEVFDAAPKGGGHG